jgi:hypothetical protein
MGTGLTSPPRGPILQQMSKGKKRLDRELDPRTYSYFQDRSKAAAANRAAIGSCSSDPGCSCYGNAISIDGGSWRSSPHHQAVGDMVLDGRIYRGNGIPPHQSQPVRAALAAYPARPVEAALAACM